MRKIIAGAAAGLVVVSGFANATPIMMERQFVFDSVNLYSSGDDGQPYGQWTGTIKYYQGRNTILHATLQSESGLRIWSVDYDLHMQYGDYCCGPGNKFSYYGYSRPFWMSGSDGNYYFFEFNEIAVRTDVNVAPTLDSKMTLAIGSLSDRHTSTAIHDLGAENAVFEGYALGDPYKIEAPEPALIGLMSLGVIGLGAMRRRKAA